MEVVKFFESVSFYRFRAYTYPFQDNLDTNHPFIRDIDFNTIWNLYEFDRKLRLICMDAIERIEVSIRTQLIYHMSHMDGWQWHTNKNNFGNTKRWLYDLKKLNEQIGSSTEVFIKDHKKRYSLNSPIPSLKSFEAISFGLLSKFYNNLKPKFQKKISRKYSLPAVLLVNWLHGMAVIRNICAHHGRLYNRKLTTSYLFPRKKLDGFIKDPTKDYYRLFMSLSSLLFLLKNVDPHSTFLPDFNAALVRHNIEPNKLMHFPTNWNDEPLWKLK